MATLEILFSFNKEILFCLMPPIANHGIEISFVRDFKVSIPKGTFSFFVEVAKTGPIPK